MRPSNLTEMRFSLKNADTNLPVEILIGDY